MKCRQAQDLIGAYIYGDLAADEMRDLRVHAQECALCREDLASRGRIVSALDDSLPTLTDEERQRIAWSVKGAVRKEQFERRPLALRLMPTFALAGVLVAGIFVGRYVVTRSSHTHGTQAAAKNSANVQIKELPSANNNAKPDQIADQVSQLLQSLTNSTGTFQPDRNTSQGRALEPGRRLVLPPEPAFKIVPHQPQNSVQPLVPDANSTEIPKDSAPAVNKTETGTDSEPATQLPRVTDPKNAETTPSENK